MKKKLGVILFVVYKLTVLKIKLFFTNKYDYPAISRLNAEAENLEILIDQTFNT